MTTGDPEPQTEQGRQLSVTSDLVQLTGLMEFEADRYRDDAFRPPRHMSLTLFGPIARGTSICWLVYNGVHPVLSSHRHRTGRTSFGSGPWRFSVSPGMTLQQVYDQIAESGLDPCEILHVGQLRAIPLPQGRLRLLFAVAGFQRPSFFWRWVDDLTAELDRLDFHPVVLSAVPPLDGPPSPTSPQQDQPAEEAQPWMQIPDLRDREMVRLRRSGLSMPKIADKLGYSKKTIRNRLSKLRTLYGTDMVPTFQQLRKLKVR